MSRTNQVCVCCEERMSCPHFDTNNSVCKRVLENINTNIDFSDTLNNNVVWQQVRIQASIAAMQGLVSNEIHLNHADKVAEEKGINTSTFLAKCAIDIADALIAELKERKEDKK